MPDAPWSAAAFEARAVSSLLPYAGNARTHLLAARADDPDLTEAETREALAGLDPLWDELFPAEQARIVRLLVERVDIGPGCADIRLRTAGLAGLVHSLGALGPDALRAA